MRAIRGSGHGLEGASVAQGWLIAEGNRAMPERIRILHTLNIQGPEAGPSGPGATILATQEAEGGRSQIQGLCVDTE